MDTIISVLDIVEKRLIKSLSLLQGVFHTFKYALSRASRLPQTEPFIPLSLIKFVVRVIPRLNYIIVKN